MTPAKMEPNTWHAIAFAFFMALIIAISGVLYTNHVQRTADRRWCELLISWDDALKRSPPTTESGRRIAPRIAEMRRDFGCTTAK